MATAPISADLDQYDQAKSLVIDSGKPSTSWLQRQLRIGYNSAAQLIERMEAEGLLSAPDYVGRRTVLAAAGSKPAAETAKQDAVGTRLRITLPAEQQMTIPVDLPEHHREADDRLRLLIERIERLEEEKKGIRDDIADVYAEMKATGYDAKIARQIIRLRKMRPDDRREMEAILDTYKCALGLD